MQSCIPLSIVKDHNYGLPIQTIDFFRPQSEGLNTGSLQSYVISSCKRSVKVRGGHAMPPRIGARAPRTPPARCRGRFPLLGTYPLGCLGS